MRIWLDPGAAGQARAHRGGRGRGGARAERADRRGPGRLAAGAARPAARAPAAHQGPPLHRRGVRGDRDPRRAGRVAAAPRRRRARRARRAELRRLHPAHRPAGDDDRRLPAARGERARGLRGGARRARAARRRASRPASAQMVRYDPTRFVAESIAEVLAHALRGHAAGLPGRLRLPPGLARHADPGGHDPRLAGRHLRGALRDRLLDQHDHALRPGARDRPGGGRRDRRGGERRAPARRRASRAARRCCARWAR